MAINPLFSQAKQKAKQRGAVLLALGLLFCANSLALQPNIPLAAIKLPQASNENSLAAKRATTRLTQSHYRKFELNDAFSQKVFDRYLDMLDFNHNIFLQADIDKMRAEYADKLDEALNEGDLTIAFAMYQQMMVKRYERYQYALSLLDKQPDLTGEDRYEVDREKAPWPKTEAEADALWLQRVKNDIITLYLKDKKWSEIKKTLAKRYNLAIRRLTQTKADDITQLFLNAFAREIDPHTSYLAPRTAKSFNEEMNLSLEGIGATLSAEDDEIIIKSLVPGAPADRSKKLAAGDKILGVGQEKGEIEEVIGWRLDDVVDKIKGKKGSKVRLEIEPAKGGRPRVVTLVRDQIRIEDRAAKLTINNIDGQAIANIKIPSFYIGLSKDVRQLLADLKSKDVQALVIDLRDNGGGALDEAVELTGLFITDGPVVQVRDSFGRIRVHYDLDSELVYDGPLVVMVNRFSASASEIFAAAIQDYNRGVVIGQNTFGKGTVQQSRSLNFVYDLNQNPLGYLQYTIQKFYRINGGSTQLKGVAPDIAFPEVIDAKEYGEDKEDNALPWDKLPSARYAEVGNVNREIATLTEKHQARVAKDPEFIALAEDLAVRNERRERQYLSLNLKERQAENNKDEARRLKNLNERFGREGKKKIKDIDDLPKDYEAPDFFLTEAEKIASDLSKLAQ